MLPTRIAVRVCSCLAWAALATVAFGQSNIVISQVYGGGGNAGATFRNDFVELFNRGTSPVNFGGWKLQYASASGSTWDRADLSGTIQPGQYYLVQLAQGNGGSMALPSPDASGSLNLSATTGKLGLVSNSTVLTGASPAGPYIVDFVGYGDANFSEGQAIPALTNTTSAIRRLGGCDDTNDNRSDFTSGQPSPRNSRSPIAPCFVAPTPTISAAGVASAATFLPGAVAPGDIVTISGTLLGPESLSSLQLTADRQFVS